MISFRDLKANEVEIRIGMVRENGLSLLLYKNSRTDMDLLDEVVGPMNWQRHHTRENHNCIVSIYDEKRKEWIQKEDTGTESYTEKEKGLASDSFKRACTNWGIGRELYSAPFIWVSSEKANIKENKGKWICRDRFEVTAIKSENKRIIRLAIKNTTKGCSVFDLNPLRETKKETETISEEDQKRLVLASKSNKSIVQALLKEYKYKSLKEIKPEHLEEMIEKAKFHA